MSNYEAILSAINGLRKDYKNVCDAVHRVDKGLVEVNTNYSWVIAQLRSHENMLSNFGVRLEKVEKSTGINRNENKWLVWLVRGLIAIALSGSGYLYKALLG